MFVCILACVLDAMGRPTVVVEERARPASMERSSIVPSFAWMKRLHYALARLALFPLLSSDTLPRDAGGAGKLPERKQTNPYAVRAGGRRIRRCMCVAEFNRVQRSSGGMVQCSCTGVASLGVVGTHGRCGRACLCLTLLLPSWSPGSLLRRM